jgi:hypothetical protein
MKLKEIIQSQSTEMSSRDCHFRPRDLFLQGGHGATPSVRESARMR